MSGLLSTTKLFEKAGVEPDGIVVFCDNDQSDPEDKPEACISVLPDLYAEFGEPDHLTVRIMRGDTLNDGSLEV